MPEGDTLFKTATTLRKALVRRAVTRFETSVDAVAVAARRHPLIGRNVQAVESRGKHLLIVLRQGDGGGKTEDGQKPAPSSVCRPPSTSVPNRLGLDLQQSDMVLHTHLRMTGSWHIYRPGERWQKPEQYARVVIYTEELVAPCFSAPVVELLTARGAARHPDMAGLGPDAITPEFNVAEALGRLKARPELEIGVALMNQRVLAGVGNVFKSELLFIRRISPFLKVRELSDDALTGLMDESHRLLTLNRAGGSRQTRFTLNPAQRLWVYGRGGEPCLVCGTPIRMRRQGLDGRSTYYCPRCQQVDG